MLKKKFMKNLGSEYSPLKKKTNFPQNIESPFSEKKSPLINHRRNSSLVNNRSMNSNKKNRYNQMSLSRFESEFTIVKTIFENCNASVYQAVHHIDGCVYAVKKICEPLDESDPELAIAEARMMPRKKHPNLVRYNTSWVEKKIKGSPENALKYQPKKNLKALKDESNMSITKKYEMNSFEVRKNNNNNSQRNDFVDRSMIQKKNNNFNPGRVARVCQKKKISEVHTHIQTNNKKNEIHRSCRNRCHNKKNNENNHRNYNNIDKKKISNESENEYDEDNKKKIDDDENNNYDNN
ncbi:hypothetical protein TRFO_37483 [Tritrichomonas foetus]|uniref:non-specific serine/threonine protein kinase n=1 Tax=Tritrichomonas foetus TaxID=1144522 RepID=A0A1J4JCI2_9EUKA|nr:hypothetical protein TRFO_37483 [Tritrichomonas foetus]|eukprot:OHS96377.1 hypothetical protein TRFO_37483 [Tritrichomonas foetus]